MCVDKINDTNSYVFTLYDDVVFWKSFKHTVGDTNPRYPEEGQKHPRPQAGRLQTDSVIRLEHLRPAWSSRLPPPRPVRTGGPGPRNCHLVNSTLCRTLHQQPNDELAQAGWLQ